MFKKVMINILLCFLCTSITCVSAISVNAHELTPKALPKNLTYNSDMRLTVAEITYDMTQVININYRNQLSYAINDWEWYDNGHVSLRSTPGLANVYATFYDSYPSSFHKDSVAATSFTNYSENQSTWSYSRPLMGPVYREDNLTKIIKCKVYANVKKQRSSNFNNTDIHKSWTHEIGHTLGLNDTNDGTVSVMKQGKGSSFGWAEYWKPQNHDRDDLRRFNYRY